MRDLSKLQIEDDRTHPFYLLIEEYSNFHTVNIRAIRNKGMSFS